MAPDKFALAGAIFLAALSLAILALVAAHFVHAKVKQMSLLDDAEAVFTKIEGEVKAAVAPVLAELEQVKSDLATAMSEKASLMARLEQFGETVVAAVTPAPAVEAAPAEQPAA